VVVPHVLDGGSDTADQVSCRSWWVFENHHLAISAIGTDQDDLGPFSDDWFRHQTLESVLLRLGHR